MPTDHDTRIAAAYGPALNVRALRGRDVTSVTVEIPCEYHVTATGLLYEKTVIVTPVRLPVSIGYGIVHSDMLSESAEAGSDDSDGTQECPPLDDLPVGAMLAHVAVIRPAPSRGVTVLTLEMPLDQHVDATSLLFGRDVLIAPSSLPATTPLGRLTPSEDTSTDEPAAADRAPARQQGRSANEALGKRPPGGSGLTPKAENVNPARWLGINCAEAAFQEWLQVSTEGHAVARVRELCGVESRREIATNPQAKQHFMTRVYGPYREHQRKLRLAQSAHSQAVPISAFARFTV